MNALDKRVCKAARALLEWTSKELAERSGVNPDTIRSFESGRTKMLSRQYEYEVLKAFTDAGLVITPENGGGAGVRFAKPDATKIVVEEDK